ncbi:MAG: hypothetical protein HUJ98_02675 [Bacteroidaceae bacterium]|nr:hypothetical protein [Bacteroidaceae bacterium]
MKRLILLAATLVLSLSSFGQNNTLAPLSSDAWEHPTGPYQVVADEDLLAEHTVFYPKDLDAFPTKDKLPILVMSGPGCVKSSAPFRAFFTEVASHGYIMIVSGPLTRQEGMGAQNVKEDMITAIDWAFCENSRNASQFYGKIDTRNVCAMGQSCGGIQAIDNMLDPRITLLCLFNSGLFEPSADNTTFASLARPKEPILEKLHTPIAYFVGDTDMARPNATGDYDVLEKLGTKQPVLLAVRHIEGDAHGGTFRETNGGAFGVAAVAWLDWHTKGKQEASRMFSGPFASISQDPEWVEVRKMNIDPSRGPVTRQDWPAFQRYEEANKSVTGTPDMVLMGDSITDYWYNSDQNFFDKNNFVGRGIAGQTASQMLTRFYQDVISLHPKAVMIMAGTNDLCQQMMGASYYPDSNITGNIFMMCELAKEHGIKVILSSITPVDHYMPIPDIDAGSRIVEINSQLKAYAEKDKNVTYMDLHTPFADENKGLSDEMSYDGVHPNVYLYSFMEDIVVDTVKKVLKTKKEYYTIPQEEAKVLKQKEDEQRAERMKAFRNAR